MALARTPQASELFNNLTEPTLSQRTAAPLSGRSLRWQDTDHDGKLVHLVGSRTSAAGTEIVAMKTKAPMQKTEWAFWPYQLLREWTKCQRRPARRDLQRSR